MLLPLQPQHQPPSKSRRNVQSGALGARTLCVLLWRSRAPWGAGTLRARGSVMLLFSASEDGLFLYKCDVQTLGDSLECRWRGQMSSPVRV
jgi:hypothetical protein